MGYGYGYGYGLWECGIGSTQGLGTIHRLFTELSQLLLTVRHIHLNV